MKRTVFSSLIASTFVLIAILTKNFTGNFSEVQNFYYANVTRIVDGDTFVIDDGTRVRLIGVNAPELRVRTKKTEFTERFSLEAKNQLKALIEGKMIKLRFFGQDKYGRVLAYAWVNNTSVNEFLLKNGLAHTFFVSPSKEKEHYYDLQVAAMKKRLGIWNRSRFYGCIKIVKFNYKVPEYVEIKNSCNKPLNMSNWYIKDEDHHFLFISSFVLLPNKTIIVYSGNKSATFSFRSNRVWNDDGDSIFIKDSKGFLVFFYHY